MTVRFREDQIADLDQMASEKDVSRSAVVREAIDKYLDQQERQNLLKYRGAGWEGDLNELRRGRFNTD